MKVLADKITRTAAPASYPVTTAEAKSHLRVDISDDDTLIASMISAATDYVELATGRSFVTRTYRADLSAFADVIELPMRPIISVTSIKYYDTSSPEVAAENVADAIKAAILLIVGDLYENRESSVTGLMYAKTKTVEMLLAPYRFYQ